MTDTDSQVAEAAEAVLARFIKNPLARKIVAETVAGALRVAVGHFAGRGRA
jgi:hypothetical protein